jgi:hypothetical protein
MSIPTPVPVTEMIEAANAHDTNRFLAGFADDGVVDDWGREFRGAKAIRGWSDQEFIGAGVSLTVTDIERAGEDTVVTAQVGGDGFNGPSHFTFQTNGRLVARMTIRA